MNESLIHKKLTLVVKYKMQPEDALVLMEEKPIINTLKQGDKEAFMLADFVIQQNEEQDVKNAKHIMYWKLKDEENAVKITGVAWFDDDNITLFNGKILEP